MKDRLFEIWFALRCGVANTEFRPLLEQYATPYELFNADEAELEALPCSPRLKASLADKSLQRSMQILEYCQRNGVHLLFWQDEAYPASLRTLRDSPVLLYYRGKLPDFARRLCISVVGTRRMSEYGRRMAYKIGYELAAAGAVVVSGMALGNDSVAAAGAISAGGQTVALMGCGIDQIYPAEHERLCAAIVEHGVVMSEFPPGTPPEGKNFPIRNRIISGLSQGTVVVEGDLRSGALITARTAIMQGRDIYAFPANVGAPNAAGSNQLISDGAAVILKARDVLDNYTFLYRDSLDMVRLLKAETCSEPDEQVLDRLGVYTRSPSDADTTSRDRFDGDKTHGRTKKKDDSVRQKATSKPPRVAQVSPSPADKAAPSAVASELAVPPLPNPAPANGDASQQLLRSLTDTQRRIFEALPIDHAVPVDYLTREGFSLSEIMASMTILEIKGLVVTLPGGLYARK